MSEQMREIWHVVVNLPKYDVVDNYYFASKVLVLGSINLTYHKCPDRIEITQTDDEISVKEDGCTGAIVAKRIFIPRDVRTEIDHF